MEELNEKEMNEIVAEPNQSTEKEPVAVPPLKKEGTTLKKSHKRILTGVVISNKAEKTIIVKFERQVAHPIYKKYYKKSKKVMAHDESNNTNVGDIVKIKECRPLSARKRWELIEIVQRAK